MNQPAISRRARFTFSLAAAIILGGATAIACGDDDDATVIVTPNTPAQPTTTTWSTILNGANENPANPAVGAGTATIVKSGLTYTYTVKFANLTAAPTGSHIHAPALAGTNAAIRVNFNLTGVTGTTGSFTGTFTAADIVSPPITGDSLDVLMTSGYAYVNIHTPAYPGGEIRGQLVKTK